MKSELKMFKYSIFLVALIFSSACQSSSGEEYLSFQKADLMDGKVSVDPRLNFKVDPSKMQGAIYVYVDQSKIDLDNCKVEAKILSKNMNLEKSRFACDTNNKSCFFNTGDHRGKPRIVLRVRDGSISDIDLEVNLLEQRGKNCISNSYKLTLKPEIKKVNEWKKIFSR